MAVRVRERRTLPFFQIVKADTAAVRGTCTGRDRCFALATYAALVEVANDQRTDAPELSYQALAALSGISVRKLHDVTETLAKAGVLEIESGRSNGTANVWSLRSAEREGSACGAGVPTNGADPGMHAVQTPMETGQEAKEREDAQAELDIEDDERVGRLIAWHSTRVETRSGTRPPRSTKARQAASSLIAKVNGDSRELAEMFEWALGRTFWASKVLTLAKFNQHYAALRMEWLASRDAAARRPDRESRPDQPFPSYVSYENDRQEITR